MNGSGRKGRIAIRRLSKLPLVMVGILIVFVPLAAYADVDTFKVGSIRVNSSSCRQVPVYFHIFGHEDMSDADLTGNLEIWRGSSNVGNDFLWDSVEDGTVRTTTQWCPGFEGLDSFRAVTSDLTISGFVSRYDYDCGCYTDDYVERPLDDVSTSFAARQASVFKSAKISRSGSTVILTAQLVYFSLNSSSWAYIPKGTAIALRRGYATGGGLTYLRAVEVGISGIVKLSFTQSRKYRYLFHYNQTWSNWGADSPSMTG